MHGGHTCTARSLNEWQKRTETGLTLQSIIPASTWQPNKQNIKTEKIQIDFGGPHYKGKRRRRLFLAFIDRYSKYQPLTVLEKSVEGDVIQILLFKYS